VGASNKLNAPLYRIYNEDMKGFSGAEKKSSTAQENRTVTAIINYGPFGSIELSPDKTEGLMDYLPTLSTASPENLNTEDWPFDITKTEAWPLEIEFSPGSSFSKIVAYSRRIVMVDGQPREIPGTSHFLRDILYQDLLEGLKFPEAIKKCDSIILTSIDEPGIELSLDSDQCDTIGSLIQGLPMKDPDSGCGGAPYSGCGLILALNGNQVSVEWTGLEYITVWTKGVYSRLTWYDPEG
jgi:hypothetical protein